MIETGSCFQDSGTALLLSKYTDIPREFFDDAYRDKAVDAQHILEKMESPVSVPSESNGASCSIIGCSRLYSKRSLP